MLKYICDIYLKYLSLRNDSIIRIPGSFLEVYPFEDEDFTTKILEYLESISNRIIQDKRQENIYFLLNIYEKLIAELLIFTYADKDIVAINQNQILDMVLDYYLKLIRKLVQTKEKNWIWESIKSISKVSNILIRKDYNRFNHNEVNQTVDEITKICLSSNEREEAFLKELINISFNKICIAWNKYTNDEVFWEDLFKTLKKNIRTLALTQSINFSISQLYINFNLWLKRTIKLTAKLEDKNRQTKDQDAYISLLKRWSNFLLDLVRDIGLGNQQIGFSVIRSLENNLKIIYYIQRRFDITLNELYQTQFDIFNYYFQGIEKVDNSFLPNLEKIEEILFNEIHRNLKEKIDSKKIINLYVQLVQQYFNRLSVDCRYEHPRVIKKLVQLGLLLTKHNSDTTDIIKLIDDLNKKYLQLNKEYFNEKKKTPNLLGPDEYQLCKEIHNLENYLFEYNSEMMMGIKKLLREEITKEVWNRFIGQIKYCKDVKYTTTKMF